LVATVANFLPTNLRVGRHLSIARPNEEMCELLHRSKFFYDIVKRYPRCIADALTRTSHRSSHSRALSEGPPDVLGGGGHWDICPRKAR